MHENRYCLSIESFKVLVAKRIKSRISLTLKKILIFTIYSRLKCFQKHKRTQ